MLAKSSESEESFEATQTTFLSNSDAAQTFTQGSTRVLTNMVNAPKSMRKATDRPPRSLSKLKPERLLEARGDTPAA